MIQLKMSGRAGNQFFQYMYIYKFKMENGLNDLVYVSTEHMKKNQTDNNSFKSELDEFNIKDIVYIEKVKLNFYQTLWDILFKLFSKIVRLRAKIERRSLRESDYKIIVKLLQKEMNKNGLYYYIPGMKRFYPSKKQNYIFYGCYDEYNYYRDIKNFARDVLIPQNTILPDNNELYKSIKNNNSVCVTIRRGDYLTDKFKDRYYICDNDYFKRAIQLAYHKIEKPLFVFFSDDIDWCKKQDFIPKGSLFESGKDPIWEKIRLMYSCKNFIISNSSFSWWAQFLSDNNEKVVIAPSIWNRFEYAEGLYIEEWDVI